MRRSLRPGVAALVVIAALVLTACGSDSPATSPDPTASPSATETSAAPTELPGEPSELGPMAGDVLAVVGVAHDDGLDVREGPGADQPVVVTLDPVADDVTAVGNTRMLPDSFWTEVDADGASGWVDYSFLAYVGDTTDETSVIVKRLGNRPEASTMEELGRIVADELASQDPPSSIVMTVAPTAGDVGEVTFDVIGLGDDSIRGLRLHVFGTPSEDGSSFALGSVEQTALCDRGVTQDRLCV